MGEAKDQLAGIMPAINDSRAAGNLIEAFPRTIEFHLEGESQSFYLAFDQGKMALGEGTAPQPDLVVVGDGAALARVVRGEIDITHLFAFGQITLEKGKLSEMTLLNRILWSVRRG